jgi:RHS repeat-associated protein
VALGPDGGNALQYTGRENDGTGLYYYRARYYDPLLKRFIAEDPIGTEGGINLYAYVRGDPVSLSDPYGLFNPSKALVAAGNDGIAAYTATSGTVKVAIAIGMLPAAATGVGSLPPAALLAWAAWNFRASGAALKRAAIQARQAYCQSWSQASWQNFYGLLPRGQYYDDPNDPYANPIQYIQAQGWWQFLLSAGYF